MSKPDLDEIKLLDLRQVADAVGRSEDTLDHWIRLRLFPAPIQARPGAKRQWRLSVVKAWIEKRSRARYQPPKPRGKLMRGTRLEGK